MVFKSQLALLAAFAFGWLAALPAAARPPAACPLSTGERAIAYPGGVAREVLAAFRSDIGRASPPGGPFRSGDVVRHGSPPAARVMFARRLGSRWVIAYERGGYAYQRRVWAYQTRLPARYPEVVGDERTDEGGVCRAVQHLLRAPGSSE